MEFKRVLSFYVFEREGSGGPISAEYRGQEIQHVFLKEVQLGLSAVGGEMEILLAVREPNSGLADIPPGE